MSTRLRQLRWWGIGLLAAVALYGLVGYFSSRTWSGSNSCNAAPPRCTAT